MLKQGDGKVDIPSLVEFLEMLGGRKTRPKQSILRGRAPEGYWKWRLPAASRLS